VKGADAGEPHEALTVREREVLKLIAEGNTNHEIADILCVSKKTVESHRANIMRKLDLHDVTELVKYALRKGLIKLD
jgi:DNA-binding NarL/FixJ family response regulator